MNNKLFIDFLKDDRTINLCVEYYTGSINAIELKSGILKQMQNHKQLEHEYTGEWLNDFELPFIGKNVDYEGSGSFLYALCDNDHEDVEEKYIDQANTCWNDIIKLIKYVKKQS